MLKKLKELNPEIEIYSVKDVEFKKYGTVLNIDTSEIVSACEGLTFPKSGSEYIASVEALESLNTSADLKELEFGGCPTQIGICHGYNTTMNAL